MQNHEIRFTDDDGTDTIVPIKSPWDAESDAEGRVLKLVHESGTREIEVVHDGNGPYGA
jgi:hypothetical protein